MNTKTVLITGGSSGIGLELSYLFIRDGYNLVIASLLEEELITAKVLLSAVHSEAQIVNTNTQPPFIETIAMDLSVHNAAQILYDLIQQRSINIDTLVNCAGFGHFGAHFDLDVEQINKMLILHTQTLTTLCTLFGREFVQKKQGSILNVGSTAAFQPLPFLNAYAASKAYVVSFSEALAAELCSHDVVVSCLCPGTTRTDFIAKAGIYDNAMLSKLVRKVAMSPKIVAHCGYEGLKKSRVRSIPGWSNYIHFILAKLVPNNLLTKAIVYFLTNKK